LYRRWYWALAGDHHRDLAAEHRESKDPSLASNAGHAIEALTYDINGAPSELIAYAHRHGLGDLSGPPSSDD
jgi:hypothetical protein